MHIFYKNFLYIIFIFLSFNVYALNSPVPNKFNHCVATKAAMDNFEPKKFNPSNNLLRPVGSVNLLSEQKIVLQGQIVDENCVPLSDAKIYIWHADPVGAFPYKIYRDIPSKEEYENIGGSQGFQGSASATTDNRGNFHFLSILPGSIQGENPYFTLRVKHFKHPTFQTKIYINTEFDLKDTEMFSNKELAQDSEFIIEPNYLFISDNENDKQYKFRVVVPYKNNLKSF